jgi:hypothetical protein
MRRAVVLALGGVLLLGACGGGEDGAADTSVASTMDGRGEPIVLRTRSDHSRGVRRGDDRHR